MSRVGAREPLSAPGAGDVAGVVARAFACDAALAEVVSARARLRDYPPRTTIARGEDPVEHVHLVVGGHARMLAIAAEGRASVIEDYHPGDLFGEQGLFAAARLAHDVVAVRSSRIGAFAHADFLGLMTSYAAIAMAMSRLLVTRLHHAQRRLAEGATLSVRGRVCAELLRLAAEGDDAAGDGRTITPAPVLARLALSVDSTRESVSRTIGQLERQGLLRREDDALVIVARHRLDELVY